jgi:eukaryotic-like serine/threonine-protein kinase
MEFIVRCRPEVPLESSQFRTRSGKLYQFDRLELDLARYELRRNGKRLHLARIPMELLILLVEGRGRLITREEITRHLWIEPDAIDVIQGLNSAVKRVRDVLNDDPAKPRFIETVVGKGYRFIPPVEELTTEPAWKSRTTLPLPIAAVPPLVLVDRPAVRKSSRLLQIVGLCAIAFVAAALAFFYFRRQPESKQTLSPLVQITTNQEDDPITAGAISSDGRSLAYADAEGVYLRTLPEPGRPLTAPEHFSARSVYWFPDRSRRLVSGADTVSRKAQIWIIFLNDASPLLVREDAKNGVPSPDGSRIAFTNAAGTEIFVAKPDGRDATRLVSAYGRDTFPLIVWASDQELRYERLHFQVSEWNSNRFGPEFEENYRWFCELLDVRSQQTVASISDFRMDSACPPRSGKMLFAAKQTADSRTKQLILPSRFVRALGTSYASSLSCSAGNEMAVAVLWRGQPDVYTSEISSADNTLSRIRRLTLSGAQDYPHAWTPDSRALIFESDRFGNYALFKQAVDQRTAQLIVGGPSHNVLAQVTPDGRWILYVSIAGNISSGSRTLMRVPLHGGKPEPVPIGGALDEFRCPLAGKNGCVLRETRADQAFIYYALDPVRGKREELARRKWQPSVLGDWDISPDGHVLAIPSHDPADTRIFLLPLKCKGCSLQSGQIVLHNVGTLWNATWDAKGSGLYVETRAEPEAPLVYVDLKGHARVLHKTRGLSWAVPSPDGRRLAFWQATPDQNIWRVQ